MEEPGRLQSIGSLESDTTEQLHFHFSLSCIGEGNGSPLQCSCLENPRDGGSWWAAVYWVAQSRKRLKWLSRHIFGIPGGSMVKNPLTSAGDTGDMGLIPGSGRSPGEGNGNPPQFSCLENSMDRRAWWATSMGSQSWTWPSMHTQNFWRLTHSTISIVKLPLHLPKARRIGSDYSSEH